MKVRCLFSAAVFSVVVLFLSYHRPSFSDDFRGRKSLRIVFYNTENLFHPGIDSLNPDHEFTPSGTRFWSWNRYRSKVHRIAKVILATGGWEAPAIVGLCEIENASVLWDLIKRSPLQEYGYKFIHHESPDPRGIDVAILYRPEKVRVLADDIIAVEIRAGAYSYFSRDILYAKLLLMGEDTLHVFVNHWPSRRSGATQSRWKREKAAKSLAAFADQELSNTDDVLLMGDFNDEVSDSSVQLLFRYFRPELSPLAAHSSHIHVYGSIVYDAGTGPEWYGFDSFYLSKSMMKNQNALHTDSSFSIFSNPFLLEENENGFSLPYRCYKGYQYREAFSDHLPVYIDINIK